MKLQTYHLSFILQNTELDIFPKLQLHQILKYLTFSCLEIVINLKGKTNKFLFVQSTIFFKKVVLAKLHIPIENFHPI